MTFKGIIFRLLYLALATWIIVAFIGSFGWAFYFALIPILSHEMLRPRPAKRTINPRNPES